jgi:hypothetical protein
VFVKNSDTLYPIGVFGGQVVLIDNAKFSSPVSDFTHGDFSDFVGAAAHSAGTSEWTAIIWAVLWVIQAGFIVPVVIHADACVQFLCADGEQRWRSEPIKFLSRALVMTCRQKQQLAFRHVKSHQGEPFNELADHYAKFFSCGKLDNVSPPCSFPQVLLHNPHALHWLWLSFSQGLDRQAWPPTGDGKMIITTHPTTHQQPQIVPIRNADLWSCSNVSSMAINLRIATANVLTLQDPKKFRRIPVAFTPGRLDFLREAFKKNHYHLIGVQEANASIDSTWQSQACFAFVKEGAVAHESWNFGRRTITLPQTKMKRFHLTANPSPSSTSTKVPFW